MSEKKTLYERLGGYDAITAVANDLLSRLQADPQVGRFCAHRGEDGLKRESTTTLAGAHSRLSHDASNKRMLLTSAAWRDEAVLGDNPHCSAS